MSVAITSVENTISFTYSDTGKVVSITSPQVQRIDLIDDIVLIYQTILPNNRVAYTDNPIRLEYSEVTPSFDTSQELFE
jgi:hypothetical protein